MNIDEEEFSSDSNDDDYVPTDREAASEEEDSGLDEKQIFGENQDKAEGGTGKKKIKKKTRKKQGEELGLRKRRGGIKLDDEGPSDDAAVDDDYGKQLEEQLAQEKTVKKEEDDKKKADSLWADFMKDVGGPKTKPKPASSGLGTLSALSKPVSKACTPIATVTKGTGGKMENSEDTKPSKVTITTEYDFAGEVVKVVKEVDANSKEAKAEMKKQEAESEEKPTAGPSLSALKRPGGGLGSVLGKINKKQKISTLEKSKLDWNVFKTQEGISDELEIHNRGKDGYLERMAFLQRTDLRQFEIEKNLRLSNSKR